MADWTPPEAAAEEWLPPEAVKPSGSSVVTFKNRQPVDTLFQEDSSEPGSFGVRLGPQATMPTKSRLPAGRTKAEAGSLEAARAPHEDEFLPMQSTTAGERRSAAMKELNRRLSPQAAAGEVAAGLDMVAGLPSLGVKIFTRGFGQVVAELGAGVSHKAANMVADELAAEWSDSNVIAAQPFRRLMAFLGMGEAYDESHISKAMEWLMKHQEELLEKPIEEKTGGALTQSDVRWIVESAMFTLGTRGMQKVGEAPRPKKPETPADLRTARPEDILAKFEEPEAPPTQKKTKGRKGKTEGYTGPGAEIPGIPFTRESGPYSLTDWTPTPEGVDATNFVASRMSRGLELEDVVRKRAEIDKAWEIRKQELLAEKAKETDALRLEQLEDQLAGVEDILRRRAYRPPGGSPRAYQGLAVAGAVGLAAYAATEDGGDSVTLAALAAMPISRRLDRVSEALPKADPIRGMIDAARVGGPSALHHLDNARMELVARGAPRELLRELDTATRAMEAQQFGKTEIPSWVLPAYAATAVVNKKLDDYNRLRESQKMLKDWKEDSRIPVEAGVGFISLAALTRMPEATPFKVLHEQTRYTTKFLDHVAKKYPGQWDFSVKQLRQELGKAGAGAEERAVFEQILGKRERITAKELIGETRVAIGDFELTPKVFEGMDHFETYGLERIDRLVPDEDALADARMDGVDLAELMQEGGQLSRTTIYQSPLDLPPSPHFPDVSKYFAHTRSFDEGGIRHVVEVQSDLIQRLGKVLSPEERARLERHLDQLISEHTRWLDADDALWRSRVETLNSMSERGLNATSPEWETFVERSDAQALRYFEAAQDARRRAAEVASKLDEAGRAKSVEPILPITRDWYKRLIREEVAEATRAREVAEQVTLKADLGPPVVRFATADTVVKVEGWPTKLHPAIFHLEHAKIDLEGAIRRLEARKKRLTDLGLTDIENALRTNRTNVASAEDALRYAQRQVDEARARGETLEPTLDPLHQRIYDRYRNGVEKFLRSEYHAREVTDSAGHTWLEIDLPKEPPQIAIWGAAGAAVGAGLLATWLDGGDESPLALAALAAVPAKGKAAKVLPAAAAIGAGAALTAYLSDPGNKALNAGLAAAVLGVAAYAKSSNPVIKRWAEGSGLAAEVVFGNLSSELRTMSEPLLRRMTNHERLLKIREHNALRQISPFAKAVVKLPDNIREALDMALMSSDRRTATKLIDSLGRPELSSALRATYAYIDNTGTELQRFNLVKKLGADHFPRIVTDLDGLMAKLGKGGSDYLGKKLGEANTQKLKRSGDPLNDIEMSRVVNEHLQAAINQSDLGGQSGILKKRSIAELRKELLPFYATAGDSIAIYARAASREIERARFFGKDLRQAKDSLAVNVDASIGALVKAERAAGNLSPEGLQRLESLLRSRFGPGERSGHYITQSYRSIVQALLLGNPFSAMTQFGDAAIAVAIHGVLPTIKGVGQAILDTANSKLGTTAKWRLEDFGLVQHITEELVRGSREPYRIGGYEISSAKFLDKTLKWSGFSFVDEFSKLVNLNAAAAKFEKLARTEKGRAEIMRRYGEYFGGDSARLIEDLKVGRKSPLVGELIFRELSDLQPITKLEMAQGYLASPNTRPAYVLKSFMIKQMNLVRERGFREIAKGDAASVARGTEFLVRYSLALGMSGAGLTLITNWLLGKATDVELADVAENVFKTFGWSSYAIDKAKKEGLVTAAVGTVLPPFKLFDDIARTPGELRKWVDGDPKANPKGVSYFPVVGKYIYHRVFGGAEKADAREEKLKARKERERLKELMGD